MRPSSRPSPSSSCTQTVAGGKHGQRRTPPPRKTESNRAKQKQKKRKQQNNSRPKESYRRKTHQTGRRQDGCMKTKSLVLAALLVPVFPPTTAQGKRYARRDKNQECQKARKVIVEATRKTRRETSTQKRRKTEGEVEKRDFKNGSSNRSVC